MSAIVQNGTRIGVDDVEQMTQLELTGDIVQDEDIVGVARLVTIASHCGLDDVDAGAYVLKQGIDLGHDRIRARVPGVRQSQSSVVRRFCMILMPIFRTAATTCELRS